MPGGRDAQRAGLAGRRSAAYRCCCSTPTSRRTTPTCAASPTGSTAATRTSASARRSSSASAGCGRSGPSAPLTGHPQPERVPHQRGARGLPGPGAHPGAARRRAGSLRRGAGRRARGHGLHHAHAGARRHRPVPGRHGAPLLPRLGEVAAAARRRADAGPRARRRGQPEHVQHGAHGSAPGPARQRRLEAARRGVARTCSAALGGFDADEVPIGSVTNGVHGRRGRRARWTG